MAGKSKWTLDLEKYAKKKGEQLEKVRKQVAIEMYTGVVEKTPVDTGRARGNWQIGIGIDITTPTDRESKTGAFGEELPKLGKAIGDEKIFISNNLPYIVALEYGHSKQAPNGMVGLTFIEIQSKIKELMRGIK